MYVKNGKWFWITQLNLKKKKKENEIKTCVESPSKILNHAHISKYSKSPAYWLTL